MRTPIETYEEKKWATKSFDSRVHDNVKLSFNAKRTQQKKNDVAFFSFSSSAPLDLDCIHFIYTKNNGNR